MEQAFQIKKDLFIPGTVRPNSYSPYSSLLPDSARVCTTLSV